jgi:hypothetical protein
MHKALKIFSLFSCLLVCACAYDFIRLGTITGFMKDEKIALIWYYNDIRNIDHANIVAQRLRSMGYNVGTDIDAPAKFSRPDHPVTMNRLYELNSKGIIESARNRQMDRVIFVITRCVSNAAIRGDLGLQTTQQDACGLSVSVRNVKSNFAVAEDSFYETRRYRLLDKPAVSYSEDKYSSNTRYVTKYAVEYTESFDETEARLREIFFSKFK